MSWTYVVLLALMPLLAESANLTQQGFKVCTQKGDKLTIHIGIFKYNDSINGVLFLNATNYYQNNMRSPVNVENCTFFGDGSAENHFSIQICINTTDYTFTVQNKSNGADITEFCPNIVYTENGAYFLTIKSVEDTMYMREGHQDVVYNVSCSPADTLDQTVALAPASVGDVDVRELTSAYNVSCYITPCNSTTPNAPEHVYSLSDQIQITCKLWFDDTKISKVFMDIIKVTYDQTSSSFGTQLLVDNRCGVNNSKPWAFNTATSAFIWEGDRLGSADNDATVSDNWMITKQCFKAYTLPRGKAGTIQVMLTLWFKLACLSNSGSTNLMNCKNDLYSCYGGNRRKRAAFEESPEEEEEHSVSMEVLIDGGSEELSDNESTEETTKEESVEAEMACFQKTTFAVLTSIVGLLLILLLVCAVLFFLRMRRDKEIQKEKGY